jgi:hypothetical protein
MAGPASYATSVGGQSWRVGVKRWILLVGALTLAIAVGVAGKTLRPSPVSQLTVVVLSQRGPDPPSGYILEAQTITQIRSLACLSSTANGDCWPDAKLSENLVLFGAGGLTMCLHVDHVSASETADTVMLHFYSRKGTCSATGPGRPMLLIGIPAQEIPAAAKQSLPRVIDHPGPPVVFEYIDT